MASKKISDETAASTLDGSELALVVQAGANRKTTLSAIAALATGSPGVGVPTGGSVGQVLTKASGTDFDTHWVTPSGGGGGGSTTFGAYGSRPTAATLGAGNFYVGTDTNETYYSDGSTYTVMPGGGTETGYCEITSTQSTTSSTTVAITGMLFTFVAGERPFMLKVDGLLHGSSASVWAGFSVEIGTSIGTVTQRMTGDVTGWTPPSASGGIYSALVHFEHRFSQADGFTPGVTYTVVLKVASLGSGGTVSLAGTATQPFFMQTATL